MKKTILLTSLGSASVSTIIGLASIYASNKFATDLFSAACVIGLFSISSFFVGLAFPSTIVETYSSSDNGLSGTKVVNR